MFNIQKKFDTHRESIQNIYCTYKRNLIKDILNTKYTGKIQYGAREKLVSHTEYMGGRGEFRKIFYLMNTNSIYKIIQENFYIHTYKRNLIRRIFNIQKEFNTKYTEYLMCVYTREILCTEEIQYRKYNTKEYHRRENLEKIQYTI